MEPKRLNKFISDAGFCSRREADQLIVHERVTVNGKLPDAGTKVSATDKVRIDGQLLHVREEAPVFLVFNKPPGIATTTDRSVRNNILSALNYPASLQPIGFLDRESEGLILLCNDLELARKITKADNLYEKEYVVTVDKLVNPDFLARISENDSPTGPRKKSAVTREGTNRFRIVLEPGMYHNIKRRCEELGFKVQHLQRVRISSITPAKLPVGMWRNMTAAEIDSIKSMVAGRGRKANASAYQDFDDEYEMERPARPYVSGGGSGSGRPGRPTGRPASGARAGGSSAAGAKPQSKRLGAGPERKAAAGAGPGRAPKAGSRGGRGAAKGPAKGKTGGRSAAPKGRRQG
ncbi:MAG: pseudouridine synthase [Adhaeribacter sp.]